MRNTILLFVFSLFVFSCGTVFAQKKVKAKVGKDFSLAIEKVSCRGNCPGYTASIDAKGVLTYEGTRNVKNIGKFTKTLTSTQLKQIVAEMNKVQFFTLKDKYDDENIADLPTTIFAYKNGGKSKTVVSRYMAPESLVALSKKLEEIMGTESETGFKKAE